MCVNHNERTHTLAIKYFEVFAIKSFTYSIDHHHIIQVAHSFDVYCVCVKFFITTTHLLFDHHHHHYYQQQQQQQAMVIDYGNYELIVLTPTTLMKMISSL